MIRHLHPTDSPALLPFKQAAGHAEACTLARAVQGGPPRFSAVRYAGLALSPRAWQNCWVKTRRTSIQALLRAGPRSGRLAWEVRDLYVRPGYVSECAEVLEDIAAIAGRAGAHRIFLRTPGSSPVFEQARRAGYVPVQSETVYRTESALDAIQRLGVPDNSLELKEREPEDDHALFRLYCAATPVHCRTQEAPTATEWQDAAERPGRRQKEWLLEGEGARAAAWLQTADLRSGRWFAITWMAGESLNLPALVSAALSDHDEGPAVTVVPEHRQPLAVLLEEAGFRATGVYDLMVKTLAARVAQPRGAVAAVG